MGQHIHLFRNFQTSFFSAGLSPEEIKIIKDETCLKEGSLPVRYLGVHLCTKKITIADCAVLLQAIKTKLNSLAFKALSFAGRQQLLDTVFTSLTNFWSNFFILPKGVTKEISSLCGKFLWKGNIEIELRLEYPGRKLLKPNQKVDPESETFKSGIHHLC